MIKLADYSDKYRNVCFERRDGILQVTLHTDGGALKWGALADSVHAQLGDAFYHVNKDRENKVVILTGSGQNFCAEMNMAELPAASEQDLWGRIMHEGKQLLMQLLDIEVPIIGAVNGPAFIHAELPVLSDIVLAADTAVFADLAHFTQGVVPGDGVHSIWPMLLGPNRGRYFLLTGQQITASEAKALGVVNEVLTTEQLLPRAWELAETLAKQPINILRNTRIMLIQPIKRRLLDELGYGLALEGLH